MQDSLDTMRHKRESRVQSIAHFMHFVFQTKQQNCNKTISSSDKRDKLGPNSSSEFATYDSDSSVENILRLHLLFSRCK